MDNDNFGARLKELRLTKAKKLGRRKIPQREVAAALTISPGAYASWESGRTKPDTEMLPKIAGYFEVRIDYLLGYRAGVPEGQERIINETGLVWSLRRGAKTENEEKGVEVWQRLARGESMETIMTALKTLNVQEIERYLLDVIYTDMISIDNPPQDSELAERVRTAFDLREVVVVPTVVESPSPFNYILLGEAARVYFTDHVYGGMKVGISGGSSVGRLVYSLRRGECQHIEIYPLAISPVVEAIAVDANSLVGTLTYQHYGYNVRGYCLQYANRQALKEERDMQQFSLTRRILAKAKSVDIAFMGIGPLKRRLVPIDWLGDLLESKGLSLETLGKERAVGDILYHLVDQNGQTVSSELDNLICSIEPKDLQEMVHLGVPVVVIAGGQQKEKIARAAIKGGYANVFIIDDELAQAMLKANEEREITHS